MLKTQVRRAKSVSISPEICIITWPLIFLTEKGNLQVDAFEIR